MKKQNTKYIPFFIVTLFVVAAIGIYFAKPRSQTGNTLRVSQNLRPAAESQYVTKGELMKLIVEEKMRQVTSFTPWRLIEKPTQHYDDVSSSHPFFIYIETARSYGITDAEMTRFEPDRIITRGEFAVVAVSAFNLSREGVPPGTPSFTDSNGTWFAGSVQSLYASGAIKIQYRPADNLERAFAKEVLRNIPRV